MGCDPSVDDIHADLRQATEQELPSGSSMEEVKAFLAQRDIEYKVTDDVSQSPAVTMEVPETVKLIRGRVHGSKGVISEGSVMLRFYFDEQEKLIQGDVEKVFTSF